MSQKVFQSAAVSVSADSSPLMGRFDHALDPKKRLTIPSEWRKAMGDPEFVYVMPDADGQCLNLLPKSEMDVLLEKLRQKALFDSTLADAAMTIGASSEQLMLDVQGRIRICDRLLEFAGLKSKVAMLGSLRMVKLWNPEKLPSENKVDLDAFKKAVQQLSV